MAEQKAKKTTTRKPKATKPEVQTAIFKGRTYEVLEEREHALKLTDGTIHFWARRRDVTLG